MEGEVKMFENDNTPVLDSGEMSSIDDNNFDNEVNFQDDVENDVDDSQQQPQQQQPQQQQQKGGPSDLAKQVRIATERQLKQRYENSPEFQIVKKLSQQYNLTPEQMLQQLQTQELQQRAQSQQVPVEILQKMEQLEQQNRQAMTQFYQLQIQKEIDIAKQSYPDGDFSENNVELWQFAQQYPNLSVKQAYELLNLDKIIETKTHLAQQGTIQNVQKRNVQNSLNPNVSQNKGSRTAWELNDKEFNSLLERVKRGDTITSF